MNTSFSFELWCHFQKCWHMQKIQIIVAEFIVPKTFYSCFLCLRNEKVINFQVFPTLVQENCWPQQKLWYLTKNVVAIWCRTVWSIFVYKLVTIELKTKKCLRGWRRGGVLMDPLPLPTYLTSKKPNPCRVNSENYCYIRRV